MASFIEKTGFIEDFDLELLKVLYSNFGFLIGFTNNMTFACQSLAVIEW